MQIKIHNGMIDLSGNTILSNIDIEINTNDKIAVVGRNGCGKTTLLRLISGELSLSNPSGDDSFFTVSDNPVIGTLNQMAFENDEITLLDAVRGAYKDILNLKERLDIAQKDMEDNQSEENIKNYTSLLDQFTFIGGFYFEKEYEAAIKKFGFDEQDKFKKLSEFSGGQRTKIAFLKLLLSKPDVLLLDEPTNHLDIEAVTWLENYLKDYKKAVIVVSHDRMFLDKTVSKIYEIEHGKTHKYIGNYTEFCKLKREQADLQMKLYEAQQKEIGRLNDLAERFRYKATKASMAQSKLKQIDRMEKIDAPEKFDTKTFNATLEPSVKSAKDVLQVENLKIGYSAPLSTVNFSVIRGDRIGIIGGNGLGKSTLLKTLVGKLPAISGEYRFGALVNTGYFDQQMAEYKGERSVFDDFSMSYPSYTDFEVRKSLGAFLFSGEDAFKTLDMLSGGEKVRLSLCKIFGKNPNLLILDEPTNHMDIASKEILEDLLLSFDGTIIFVSHDRYFVKKLANKLLLFEDGNTKFFEYGFEQYESELIARQNEDLNDLSKYPIHSSTKKSNKKNFTTPGKEKAKREKAIAKTEEQIAVLEKENENLKSELEMDENLSDYIKLQEISGKISANEEKLSELMEIWESLLEND